MGLDPRSKSVGYLCATGESILFCDSYVSLCIYPPAGRRRPARSGSAVELASPSSSIVHLHYIYTTVKYGFTVSSGDVDTPSLREATSYASTNYPPIN